MWFTRISIGNPVLATMMMVAFVVLGHMAAWARRKWAHAESEPAGGGRMTAVPHDQHEDAV